MSTKVYSEYLKFYLYLELLINLVFVGPFVETVKQEMCAKFQQQLLNSMVVKARQSFKFFRQKYLVSQKQRALGQIFGQDFASLNQYYQIIKKSVHKTQFYINHACHLKLMRISVIQKLDILSLNLQVGLSLLSVSLSAYCYLNEG